MTHRPVFRRVAGTTEGEPFRGFHAGLPDSQPVTGLPSMLYGVAVEVGDENQGEAVTAGFSLKAADGLAVDCWISARLIDGQVHVRSWTEGALPVIHEPRNPNPRWFEQQG